MKKNRMMRLASILLVCVLMTTSVISGTFAKYTTSVTDSDSARVAKWGFEPAEIVLDNLFVNVYAMDAANPWATNSVVGATDVIAPGTAGSASFGFNFDETNNISAPEVAYSFEISTVGSNIGNTIKENSNIQWKLDNDEWGTWDQLIASIEKLDGSVAGAGLCAPNTLPVAFDTDGEIHTVSWRWLFNDVADVNDPQNVKDTAMGNADTLDTVSITITVTATQVD